MVHFKDPSCNAGEIAAYFLTLSRRDGVSVDHLKLQKLLYYAQAWSLATADEALFSEKIEAWPQGPVVEGIYHEYKANGSKSIDTTGIDAPVLTPDAEEIIESVWSRYGQLTGPYLSRMTHNESPWLKARGNLKANERSNREVERKEMREYFAGRLSDSEETLSSLLPDIIKAAGQ